VAKPLALATMSPTQSVLPDAVGIQIFKKFVQLSMARPSAKMSAHHA